MCRFFSFVVVRVSSQSPEQYLWRWFTDSHSEILACAGVDDSKLDRFDKAKCEMVPQSPDDMLSPEKWAFRVDEDVRPKWFDDDAEIRARKWAEGIVRSRTITGGKRRGIYDGWWIVANDAVVQNVGGGARIIHVRDSAQISDVGDSAQISGVRDSAKISGVWDSAQIRGVGGSAQISDVGGSAQISDVGGSAQISGVWGSAQISGVWDSAQISDVRDSAQISDVRDSAQIRGVGGSAQIRGVGGSAQISDVGGHVILDASAKKYLKSWKYVLGENGRWGGLK